MPAERHAHGGSVEAAAEHPAKKQCDDEGHAEADGRQDKAGTQKDGRWRNNNATDEEVAPVEDLYDAAGRQQGNGQVLC